MGRRETQGNPSPCLRMWGSGQQRAARVSSQNRAKALSPGRIPSQHQVHRLAAAHTSGHLRMQISLLVNNSLLRFSNAAHQPNPQCSEFACGSPGMRPKPHTEPTLASDDFGPLGCRSITLTRFAILASLKHAVVVACHCPA